MSEVTEAASSRRPIEVEEPDDGASRASRRARAPRGTALAQVRTFGDPVLQLAGLGGDRVRPRARAPRPSGWSRSCATRSASASPRPSSGCCGGCSSSRPGPTRAPTAVANPRDRVALRRARHRRGGLPQPARDRRRRRARRCTPGSAARDVERRAAPARGLGARGAGAPARDRPPRRRPDPRPHRRATSARARCGRCARASSYSPPRPSEPEDEPERRGPRRPSA